MEQALLKRDLPIIIFYDFFVLGQRLYASKTWDGEPLKRMPQGWDQTRANNAIRRMEKRRALVSDSDFRSGVWRVTQATRAVSAEEVACIADPFAYVSHLSAMQKYRLTDRSPKALHLTTPRRDIWNDLRNQRVRGDLPDIETIEKPLLNRLGFRATIRRRPVIVHISSHPWTPVPISGEMRHVLDVWEREADQWVADIVEAVDHLDSKIAKVRAGYILSEMLDIDHPAIARWELLAQRGGSRKLDPEGEYLPTFSERWMISLNV